MALTFPLELPNTAVARIDWLLEDAVGIGQSPETFQTSVRRKAGQIWRAGVTLRNLTIAEGWDWRGFLMSLSIGDGATFWLPNILRQTPFGAGAGANTPRVKGAGQTGKELVSDGWPADTKILLRGDALQIDYAMYIVTAPAGVTTNASGEATIDIEPSLRNRHADNALIVTVNPKVRMRLSSPQRGWSEPEQGRPTDDGGIINIAFSAEEAL